MNQPKRSGGIPRFSHAWGSLSCVPLHHINTKQEHSSSVHFFWGGPNSIYAAAIEAFLQPPSLRHTNAGAKDIYVADTGACFNSTRHWKFYK